MTARRRRYVLGALTLAIAAAAAAAGAAYWYLSTRENPALWSGGRARKRRSVIVILNEVHPYCVLTTGNSK
jgi:hypothetical protein